MNRIIFIGIFLIFTLFSCSSKTEKQSESSSSTQSNPTSKDKNSYENSPSSNDNKSNENRTSNYSNEENDEVNNESSNGCKFEDGTYSATVEYNNPETGYSATYTLDVEVQDCQIVQINFPNDGHLDEDHISYADIDEDGNASVDGEGGKTYEIQIGN
ncbi:MAG: hypothetical protein NTU43_12860 [Bacteroidetes bacterium]|nr:hypothetical protein [Bacteroidota bacterium]